MSLDRFLSRVRGLARFKRVAYELKAIDGWLVIGWLVLATAMYCWLQRDDFRAYFDRASRAFAVIYWPYEEFGPGVTVEERGIRREGSVYRVPARSEGSLVVRFEKPADYLLDLWPSVPVTEPNEYRMEIRSDLVAEYQTVLEGAPFHWGNLLPKMDPGLAEALRRSSTLELRLTVLNRTDQDIPALHWLRVRVQEPIRPDYYVIPGLFSVLGLLLSLLCLTRALSPPEGAVRAVAIVGSLAVFVLLAWVWRSGSDFSVGPDFRNLKWGLLGFSLLLTFTGKLSNRGFLLATAPILLAFVSTVFWDESANNFYGYLHESSDAWTLHGRRMDLFSESYGFFSGNFNEREPFYVLLVHVFGELFGATNFSHLNLTLLLMTFGAVVSYVAGGVLIGRPWITLLLASSLCFLQLHHSIIVDFQREAFSFPWIALVTLAVFYRPSGPVDYRGRGALIAALLVVLILTRSALLTSLFAMAFLAGALKILAAWKKWRPPHRYEWSALGLLLLAPVIAQSPIKYNQARMYGKATHFSNQYARWNANVEFPERLGTPGFPTRQEFLANPYSGPPITYFEYLFKIRSFGDFIRINYEGLREVLRLHTRYVLVGVGRSGLQGVWFLLAGLLVCGVWVSRREKSWVLFWLAAWYLAQNVYTFHLYNKGVIGTRHVDHAFFTFLVLIGLTARKTVDQLSLAWAPGLERQILSWRRVRPGLGNEAGKSAS